MKYINNYSDATLYASITRNSVTINAPAPKPRERKLFVVNHTPYSGEWTYYNYEYKLVVNESLYAWDMINLPGAIFVTDNIENARNFINSDRFDHYYGYPLNKKTKEFQKEVLGR